MKRKVLITGVTGFAGSHLAEYLLNKGLEIYGTIRWRSKTDNIDHIKDKINLVYADIRDSHSIEEVINEVRPNYVFHLAAQSFVPMSWRAPNETLETNIIGTANLLEAIRKYKPDARIHVAGSSEEYGLVYEDEVPIKETNPLRPLSPYGVSKVAEDLLARQYHMSYGLHTIVTRAFNHTGPRRGEVFVVSNFAKQIESGKREPVIYVGNLEEKRDFTDVRDMVRAYWLAINKCEPGEAYNICSGKSWKISTVLDMLIEMSYVRNIEVRQDPSRMRPSDVPLLEGDCTKFNQLTGWKPEIPFEKTLKDLLDFWRERI